MTQQKTIALIVAAGRGTRAGGGVAKQYRPCPSNPQKSVLEATLSCFLAHPRIDNVQVMIHPDDETLYQQHIHPHEKLLPPLYGGVSRQDSVYAGLTALTNQSPDFVLIHDAARPFVSTAIIHRVLDGLGSAVGSIPAITVKDSLKKVENNIIKQNLNRENLFYAQTPQGFQFQPILQAHQTAQTNKITELTDDAAVAELAGLSLSIIAGDKNNIKLTTEEDFAPPRPFMQTHTGIGYDVHRFTESDAESDSATSITLCGTDIPHHRALIGHSDADVGLHALTDALYGALGADDIGTYFPPSDPQNKARASTDFLTHALSLLEARGGVLQHIDVTLICEQPKIAPHRERMKARLADITGLPLSHIGLKATTTEGLGFTGRGEGLAAQAIVTILTPSAADDIV